MSSAGETLQSKPKVPDPGPAPAEDLVKVPAKKEDGGAAGQLGATGPALVDGLLGQGPPKQARQASDSPQAKQAQARLDYEQARARQLKLEKQLAALASRMQAQEKERKQLEKKKKPSAEELKKKQELLDAKKRAASEQQQAKVDLKKAQTRQQELSEQIKKFDVAQGKQDASHTLAESKQRLTALEQQRKQDASRQAELGRQLKAKPPKGASKADKEAFAQRQQAAKKELGELQARQKKEAAELKETQRTVGNLQGHKGKVGSLWVNVNIAGPLAAAVSGIKSLTGTDITGDGASALRGIADDGSSPGRVYCSWHKTGRAVDLSQRTAYLRVKDGSRYRLFLPSKDSKQGIPGAELPKAVSNPYKGRKDFATLRFIDVTSQLEMHGFDRIPPNGSVSEWWHYEIPGGTWYQGMCELFGEEQFLPVLKKHVAANIVSVDKLVKNGVPKAKLSGKK